MFILDLDNLRDCPEGLIGQFHELTCCTEVHRHDFFALVWLLQGQARLFVDFQYYNIKKGTLVCIAPGRFMHGKMTWKARRSVLVLIRGYTSNRIKIFRFFCIHCNKKVILPIY